jgi:hypothetical protein
MPGMRSVSSAATTAPRRTNNFIPKSRQKEAPALGSLKSSSTPLPAFPAKLSREVRQSFCAYQPDVRTPTPFDALEFLAALSCHVPKTYESITRYYGRYSSRRRGECAKLSPPPPEEQESDYRREFSKSSWAACITRIYEIDPLECPLGLSSGRRQM